MNNIKCDNYVHGFLYQVKCSDLQPDGNQPRKYFCPESLESLSESH